MFSVIIPAYNAEKFLPAAISSVLSQSWEAFELIVVDDGSQDGTGAVVESIRDPRLKYLRQENGGVSAARNRGIRAARGEFVCFLDADDTWKENHLAVLAGLIREYSECGMYLTGYDIRLHNGQLLHKSREILKRIAPEQITSDNGYEVLIQNGYFFNTNTVCCRREVFDKVGLFAQGVKNGEDDDMWMRIFAYYPIAISKEATTVYDRSNSGATGHRGVVRPVFLDRVEGILASGEVPQHRKDSLLVWVERNKLSQARKHILAGSKAEAWKLLKQVDFSKCDRKKYLETVLCMVIPAKLVRKRIDKRDTGYYK